MTQHLEIGSQVFHNGVPVQLLCRIDHRGDEETWRVRPLFVEGRDREERFSPCNSITYVHTMRARCSAGGR